MVIKTQIPTTGAGLEHELFIDCSEEVVFGGGYAYIETATRHRRRAMLDSRPIEITAADGPLDQDKISFGSLPFEVIHATFPLIRQHLGRNDGVVSIALKTASSSALGRIIDFVRYNVVDCQGSFGKIRPMFGTPIFGDVEVQHISVQLGLASVANQVMERIEERQYKTGQKWYLPVRDVSGLCEAQESEMVYITLKRLARSAFEANRVGDLKNESGLIELKVKYNKFAMMVEEEAKASHKYWSERNKGVRFR